MNIKFQKHLPWAALVTVLINAAAMLSPIINSGDAVTYASIAQHIVLSHDWANLVLDGHAWLDKPHLPFWITAVFFKLGGVSALTYVLPGFIFHLIGAYYTYRLARMFYGKQTAVLAVLIYVSIFNLMDASIEVKAETYLIGQIMPACYYWLRYDARFRVKYLLLGASVHRDGDHDQGNLYPDHDLQRNCLSVGVPKAMVETCQHQVAVRADFVFVVHRTGAGRIAPAVQPACGECGCQGSGLQFQILFLGQSIRAILQYRADTKPQWPSVIFCPGVSCGHSCRGLWFFSRRSRHISRRSASPSNLNEPHLFFWCGAFSCTFLMFSATSFQFDYYTDIIFPFAAILCAHYLNDSKVSRPLFMTQMGLLFLLALIAISLSIYVMKPALLSVITLFLIALSYYFYTTSSTSRNFKTVIYSALTINFLYIFLTLMTALTFMQYSVAYNAAQLFGRQPAIPIYVYQMPEVARELALYSDAPCHEVEVAESLMQAEGKYYLVVRHDQVQRLHLESSRMSNIASMDLVVHKTGTFNKLLQLARGTRPLESVDFLESSLP